MQISHLKKIMHQKHFKQVLSSARDSAVLSDAFDLVTTTRTDEICHIHSKVGPTVE